MFFLPKIWNGYILQMVLPAIKKHPKVLTFAFAGYLVIKKLNLWKYLKMFFSIQFKKWLFISWETPKFENFS